MSLLRFRDHIQTPHSVDSSGRMISSKQRPVPDNTQNSQERNMPAPGGIRTRNPIKREAAVRPLGSASAVLKRRELPLVVR